LHSAALIVRPVEEKRSRSRPPTEIHRDSQFKQKSKSYDKQNLFRWQHLRRDSGSFHTAHRANDAQDAEFTFRFPTCNSIPRRVAEQAGYASNPVSRNGFGGRSKRQNIHGCRQENISCLQSHRQDHDHERYKRRDNERYRAKRRSERFRLEKSGRLAGSQNCEARADGKS